MHGWKIKEINLDGGKRLKGDDRTHLFGVNSPQSSQVNGKGGERKVNGGFDPCGEVPNVSQEKE